MIIKYFTIKICNIQKETQSISEFSCQSCVQLGIKSNYFKNSESKEIFKISVRASPSLLKFIDN